MNKVIAPARWTRHVAPFLLLICLMSLSCTKNPSPEDIVGQYVDAFNEHDVTRQMQMLADSVVFDIPRMSMHFEGKDAQLGIAEYDSVLHTEMTLANTRSVGDTLFCSITETNDWLQAAGIPSAYYSDAYFVVDNDKIGYIHAEPADATVDDFSEVLSSFVPWAYQNHPEEMSRLMPHGHFVFNGANGALAVSLLREWRRVRDTQK